MGDVAYIVENDVLMHSILNELEPFTNITIQNDAKIEQVLLERDGLPFGKVQLATGESFTAELLVIIYLCIYLFLQLFFIVYIKFGFLVQFQCIQLIKNVIELCTHN